VLEVGGGSGGPAVYLAFAGGRLTGVDINEHGVRNAGALAEARGLRGTFVEPTVSLTISAPGCAPLNYTGTPGRQSTGWINQRTRLAVRLHQAMTLNQVGAGRGAQAQYTLTTFDGSRTS
jgi:hypothetical protein